MTQDKILTFILALTVLCFAVKDVITAKNPPAPQPAVVAAGAPQTAAPAAINNSEIILQNIMTRTSIRAYKNEPVSEEMIQKIVRAGMAAPTARNLQPWKFIAVTQPAKLAKLADKLPYAKMLKSAPAAIVVCGDLKKAFQTKPEVEFWIQDCSAATENILLAAHGLGLGAVWTGVYPNPERTVAVREELGMDENLVPLCVVVLGYPAETPVPKDKWKDENYVLIK